MLVLEQPLGDIVVVDTRVAPAAAGRRLSRVVGRSAPEAGDIDCKGKILDKTFCLI